MALLASSILIAAANAEVQASAAYLFARPGDFFGAAWDAIFGAYSSLFRGAIFDYQAEGIRRIRPITETMVAAVPLIFTGLGLAVGFRSGLFNIGAQGQVLIGAAAATWVGITFTLPAPIHLTLACLAAVVVGAAWAGIAGFLKARTGANEVIVTIMLNSVSLYLVSYLLTTSLLRQGGTRPISPAVADTATFPLLLGDGFRLHLGFIVALLAAAGVWWLMERSVLGFQFRAVGANQRAARTAGIRVNLVFVLVMLTAGGLAGLGGAAQILGTDKSLQAGSAGSIGFDAITVALLGRSKPLGTVMAALLFGALRAGSPLMQTSAGTPIDIVLVIQASIVLLIAAPVLVRELSLVHRIAQLFGYSVKESRA
ncbi:MAG: ABC transporter permease [Cellulomonadaceae bacterium]|nr:ABC transporter permease [Cellulomonadaceae bacterium]